MTDKINDGGFAFPAEGPSAGQFDNPGMTLRDYFAAKAMQTLLGSEYTSYKGIFEGWQRSLSHEAYQIADAMLAERNRNDD